MTVERILDSRFHTRETLLLVSGKAFYCWFKFNNKKGVTVQTASFRCSKYSDSNPCRAKRLYDMPKEIGLWGCAPWIGLWPILVFFAPVSEKDKIKIFLVGIGLLIWAGINLAVGNAPGRDSTPVVVYILLVITGLPLLIAYFYLSYRALFQENRKRKALYATLGDAKWRRASYCVVHDQVVNE